MGLFQGEGNQTVHTFNPLLNTLCSAVLHTLHSAKKQHQGKGSQLKLLCQCQLRHLEYVPFVFLNY